MNNSKSQLVAIGTSFLGGLLAMASQVDWSTFGPKTGVVAGGALALFGALFKAYLAPAPGQGSGPAAPSA